MSYLAIARAVVTGYERNESDERSPTSGRAETLPHDERNELDERSPRLSPRDDKLLQRQIVAAVTVEPAQFDRPAYLALWARWKAHEAAEATP